MSKSYLTYKEIRQKIEGVTNETDNSYKTKAQLVAYGKLNTANLSKYDDKDFVIDDDITIGAITFDINITASLDGYSVSEISRIEFPVTSDTESTVTINCTNS